MNDREFDKLCKTNLPEYVKVNDKKYRMCTQGFLGSDTCFRITYGEYNGNCFDWDKPKLLDLFYELVDVIPEKNIYNDNELQDDTIYCLSVIDIIRNCDAKLIEIGFTELDEIVTEETQFYRELTSLLNKYSKENKSNTPDFILSNYLLSCLRSFNYAVDERERWYGGISEKLSKEHTRKNMEDER